VTTKFVTKKISNFVTIALRLTMFGLLADFSPERRVQNLEREIQHLEKKITRLQNQLENKRAELAQKKPGIEQEKAKWLAQRRANIEKQQANLDRKKAKWGITNATTAAATSGAAGVPPVVAVSTPLPTSQPIALSGLDGLDLSTGSLLLGVGLGAAAFCAWKRFSK
jgi:alanyl-tRNA synthetase